MLAWTLRCLWLAHLLMGAALASMLVLQLGANLWWMVVGALAMPPMSIGCVLLTSAITARTPVSDNRVAAMGWWWWWCALVGEYLVNLRLLLLHMPWALQPPKVQLPRTMRSCVPVVLVHGFLCNYRAWDDMGAALNRVGHPVLAVNLEPLLCAIDDYVPQIHAAVQRLCEHTGATQVALVGHSMGGLVIRAWMRRHGTDQVTQVITLGTPHVGTKMARLINAANARQMRWHKAWLYKLAATESRRTRALMHIALSPQDNVVYPQLAQVLPGASVTRFPGVGHLQLCCHPKVIDWVLGKLCVAQGDSLNSL